MTTQSDELRAQAAKLLERANLLEGFRLETAHGPTELQARQWFTKKYSKPAEHCTKDIDGSWTCYGQTLKGSKNR